jgi:GTP cyclohydrolase I
MRDNKAYDRNLIVDEAYLSQLPDLQNSGSKYIQGKNVKIQSVGIHNFNLPVTFKTRNGNTINLKTSITGTVSLEANKKGINMSRIMRSFYEYKSEIFSLNLLEKILQSYKKELDTFEATIALNFSYPILQTSLRSNLEGYQYYNITLEGKIDKEGNFEKFVNFDFVYSSACPCSYELAKNAEEKRNKPIVSHSQRSIARIRAKFTDFLWIEDLQEICLEALQTETQVIVKREDEQAFAELNGSYLKFVEDACRLLYQELYKRKEIVDFRVICSHEESLHSHDAIGVIVKGNPGGMTDEIDLSIFKHLKTEI